MAHINCIKEQREIEQLSITKIAESHGISWPTAKKYADGEFEDKPPIKQTRKRRAMHEEHEEILKAWLEEDMLVPQKQRRTATAMYNQLKAETGYTGSSRTVRHYVKALKAEVVAKTKEERQAVRLEHLPATAQVDFGEVYVAETQADESICRVRKHFLLLTFPYSNAFYIRVLPATNLECLLFALKSIFEELSGVPQLLIFDNLKPAVTKILLGPERQLNETFARFKHYYRFSVNFCNPGRGNEKGHVETNVRYVRRNYLTPITLEDDLEALNDKLAKFTRDDRNRMHYAKKQLIADLHQADRKRLLKLPTQGFEPVTYQMVRVRNNYGEVKVGDHLYIIPGATRGTQYFVKVWWDRIEVYDDRGKKQITAAPRKYVAKAEEINWAHELAVYRTKPRAIEHGASLKLLPQPLKDYLLEPDLRGRTQRVKSLIRLFETYDFPIVVKVIESAMSCSRTDQASLVNIAEYMVSMQSNQAPIPEDYTPSPVVDWRPNLSKYSQLQGGGSSE